MALVGAPEHRGQTLIVIGVDQGGAAVCIELDDVSQFNEFSLQCSAGSMNCQVSLDGVTYTANDMAWEDEMSTTPQTRVIAFTAGNLYVMRASIKSIRIQSSAGGVVNPRLMCGKVGRC